MRTARIAMVVVCCTASLLAQSARSQTVSVRTPASRPAMESAAPTPDHPSLDATVFDLQRITVATDSDLADLDIGKWRTGWKSAWLKDNSRKEEAQQMSTSLQRNLHDAMPGLITEVQNSRGSVSSAFKLYNDLNVVVESLDSLVATTRAYGRRGEAGPISNDYAALSRIRQDLSSYIQSTAASLEPRPKGPGTTASGGLPKKVVIDDNAPSPKRKNKTAVANR